jgi:dTDP-4-dehydrorhamnose 3,5-epimerase
MSSTLSAESLGSLKEVLLIKNKVFGDDRGFFLESFNSKSFQDATGLTPIFVQDNHSRSNKGVLRGIHYQLVPHAQGKLVRVANGAVFDVAVDLRRSSPTFGQWAGCELNGERGEMLWIPPGFGHAFLVLEDRTDFLYKTTDYYAPQSEASIAWDDPQINIEWPKDFKKENIMLSVKDQAAPQLSAARIFD